MSTSVPKPIKDELLAIMRTAVLEQIRLNPAGAANWLIDMWVWINNSGSSGPSAADIAAEVYSHLEGYGLEVS